MQYLFALSNLINFLGGVVILFGAILAMRHVGRAGALFMLIGAGLHLLVAVFWMVNAIGGFVGEGLMSSFDPKIFAAISVLGSGAVLMWGVGAVLVLLKVGAILKQHSMEREIQAGQARRVGV